MQFYSEQVINQTETPVGAALDGGGANRKASSAYTTDYRDLAPANAQRALNYETQLAKLSTALGRHKRALCGYQILMLSMHTDTFVTPRVVGSFIILHHKVHCSSLEGPRKRKYIG